MKIQNVKGGYDFLPDEQKLRNYINEIISRNFKLYGFKSIETPILCYYDILSDKYDAENDILKEIYKLKDQGNRKLGLRYDLTVPFAKFIALNKNRISFPFKRYEIAKVFRDGPVKPGRDREFIQCDADVVGIKGQFIEAELLSIFVKTFKELEIEIYIKYNNRKLMNGLLLEAGIEESLLPSVTTIIDKKDKITQKEFRNALRELALDQKCINEIIKLFNLSLEELNTQFKDSNNKNITEGLNEINNLFKYLKKLGINNICNFDISLARGQNYYTGNVFEVFDAKGVIKSSIASGGRYDKMIGAFIADGKEYPAVGISFGLSVIYEILKNKFVNTTSETDIYIVPMETEYESLKIANKLRKKGYSVEIEMNNKKLKKSLDYVNKQRIKYVIIIGTQELKTKKLIIKNMIDKTNIETTIAKISKLKLK